MLIFAFVLEKNPFYLGMVYDPSTLHFLHFEIGLTKLCKLVFALFVPQAGLELAV